MAECSLSMREVLGSIPDFSSDSFLVGQIIHSNIIRQVLIFMIEFQYGDVAHMVERSDRCPTSPLFFFLSILSFLTNYASSCLLFDDTVFYTLTKPLDYYRMKF
jgi:hypothetical protein